MIYIGKIERRIINNESSISCHIKDEAQNFDDYIYYSVPKEYEDYLTDEVADAFLVGVLLPAVLYNEDICVDNAISEKLYYNITHSILFTLSFIYGNKIRLHIRELVRPKFDNNAVGCGCSLGVDSFAAILQHISSECPQSYKITHLTYFNVGAMGYVDLKKAEESYKKDLEMVKSFAKEVNLPVVCLSSNFSILYKDFDFDASGDIRNFSAVLSLQKLFKKYLYGSSFTIKDFKFDISQTGFYESLLAPMLSTENTELCIANPEMNRIDKTKFIADNKYVQKYLYVCWKELIANRWPNSEIAKIKDIHLNCSRCDKCKRTMLALDLLGKLELYSSIFDLSYWNKTKNRYIAKVIAQKEKNAFYADLFSLMKEVGYTSSHDVKMHIIKLRLSSVKRFLHRVKSLLK